MLGVSVGNSLGSCAGNSTGQGYVPWWLFGAWPIQDRA